MAKESPHYIKVGGLRNRFVINPDGEIQWDAEPEACDDCGASSYAYDSSEGKQIIICGACNSEYAVEGEPIPASPTKNQTKEDAVKTKTKKIVKKAAKPAKAGKKMPRVGYRAFVVERLLKSPKKAVSVQKLLAEMKSEFKSQKKDDAYFRSWIFGMRSWLKRNKRNPSELVDTGSSERKGKKGKRDPLLG